MQPIGRLVMAVAAGCAAASAAHAEQVINVPGFADFLAVDGDSVWATNDGRVERWSRQGKLAEVAMTKPCGAMAISAGLGTSAVFGAAKDFAPAPGYRTRAWRHTGTRSG